MQVAEKTVEFVKEWIHGTYTKRQYQNYYIVKTDHANFLMKLTEKREVVAIKDPTNHIYIWDENGDNDNALSVLIDRKEFLWPNGFTRCSSRNMGSSYRRDQADMTSAVNNISKFRVCERSVLAAKHLPHPIYISLIAIGDRRFYCLPDHTEQTHPIPLKAWANFFLETEYNYHYQHPQYTFRETLPHIEKVERIRGHYVDLAGEVADQATASDGNWIRIPTAITSIDDLAGSSLTEMRKTRPNPFAYGIGPWHFDLDRLDKRDETSEENIELLKRAIVDDGRRRDLPLFAGDWRAYLRKRFPADMAASYIAYVEADDAWLEKHSEAAKAHALETAMRLSIGQIDGWVYVHTESDKRFGPYALYYKDKETFTRIVPTPALSSRIFGGSNDY